MKEYEFVGKAMGTEYSVCVVCDSKETAEKSYQIAKNDIESYEKRFSRFLDTSELSVLNKTKNAVVSDVFLDATLKARQLFSETRGIFNPLVQISRYGYNKSFEKINSKNPMKDETLYDIDFSTAIINLKDSRIELCPGQMLDYGGFLKGYLAEIIAKEIKSKFQSISGIIINLGGDIHSIGVDAKGNKFVFNIYNPITNTNDIAVELFNQSLATSGIYKRTWSNSNKNMHHILDASGQQNPTSNVVSATVICNDGAKSEAYAKVLLSLGEKNYLSQFDNKIVTYILIDNKGSIIKNI